MNKLLFSFFKRYLIVPIVLALAMVVATGTVVPKIVAKSQSSSVVTTPDVDISNYNLCEYDKFNQLKDGDYVATITSDEINLGCAVCYNSTNEINAVGLQKQSVEPWNNGSVSIVGDNLSYKFKYLHNAKLGTEFKINYYKNAICTYKITKITYNNSLKNAQNYLKDNNLVLLVPYNDFESPNGSKLYTAYLAELGGVEEWN